jgi:hypothetical protein
MKKGGYKTVDTFAVHISSKAAQALLTLIVSLDSCRDYLALLPQLES